jgi:hypothetical protein
MIVIVPGILGSVLKRDDKDVWNPSSISFILDRVIGVSLDELALLEPFPSIGSLQATALIQVPFGLHNFIKSKGYDVLTGRIMQYFQIEAIGDTCSNLHEFPYDWRLCNRVTAEALKEFVAVQLSRWRTESGNPQAKLILLAHSMGGLVCRYFVEVLGGWRDCRLLCTFGTPHRGSVSAIRYLLEGNCLGRTDVSEIMAKFPSIYQLLPTYKCILDGTEWRYPAEFEPIRSLHPEFVESAVEFHREIRQAVAQNRTSPEFMVASPLLRPIVGTDQPTPQRVQKSKRDYNYPDMMPEELEELPGHGDSTVPHVSAIPFEMSRSPSCLYVPETHGFLHADNTAVENVFKDIETLQSDRLDRVRGLAAEARDSSRPRLSVSCVEPADGRSIAMRIAVLGEAGGLGRALLTVTEPLSRKVALEAKSNDELDRGGQDVRLAGLPRGVYEVCITSEFQGPKAPSPVHDLVEID